eukprot:augustus_masked-scaffold_13-processed-gene-8.15-mRNA-1 protein AED:0.07 eAED:0.15 QI:0/-1/0/1/-1/1/1/0/1061
MDSVGGLLVLMQQDALKKSALEQLNLVVDSHWPEIINSFEPLANLADSNEAGNVPELAASILSKCYFHLEENESALYYALLAGPLFELNSQSDYELTVVGKCIDVYISLHKVKRLLKLEIIDKEVYQNELDAKNLTIFSDDAMQDELKRVVDQLFAQCIEQNTLKSFKEALGIALETEDSEKVKTVIQKCTDTSKDKFSILSSLLSYVFSTLQSSVKSKSFKNEVFLYLIAMYQTQITDYNNTNFIELFTCAYLLEDVKTFAQVMVNLIKEDIDVKYLLAYQAAFDIMEVKDQKFLQSLGKVLSVELSDDGAFEDAAKDRLILLVEILKKNASSAIYSKFLESKQDTDIMLYRDVRNALKTSRQQVDTLRGAALFAHSLLQSGTNKHKWLSSGDGKEFMKKNSNWAQFSAVASYGMIVRGNAESTKSSLLSFLPTGLPDGDRSSTGGSFVEGGALYALGMSHADNLNKKVLNYLNSCLSQGQSFRAGASVGDGSGSFSYGKLQAVEHGALLGLGCAAIGCHSGAESLQVGHVPLNTYLDDVSGEVADQRPLVQVLLDSIRQDEAVVSEAAAYSLGLVCLGSGDSDILDQILFIYSSKSDHEKITRALGLSFALILLGHQESCESYLKILTEEKNSQKPDVWTRYAVTYMLGLAYIGTADADVLKRLFRYAVTDISDEVRRAAVTNIGFVCLNHPNKVGELVEQLSESFNPHIRYGSAMALAIAAASGGVSATSKISRILEKLREDKVDFVQQGATIAASFLYVGKNWDVDGRAEKYKNSIIADIKNTKKPPLAKMGAYIAFGLLQAGGRNQHVELKSKQGVVKKPAVAGLVLFLQYWYWFPLLQMISHSLTPMALIGVSVEIAEKEKLVLLERRWSIEYDCPEKLLEKFKYPKPIVTKVTQQKSQVEKAILSISAKQKGREKAKALKKGNKATDTMEVEEKAPTGVEVLVAEKSFARTNPTRVTPEQSKYVVFPNISADNYFKPVACDAFHSSGIVVLTAAEHEKLEGEAMVLLRVNSEADAQVETGESVLRQEQPATQENANTETPAVQLPDSFEYDSRS